MSVQSISTNNTTTTTKQTHPVKSFFKKVLWFFIILFMFTCVVTFFYFNSSSEKGYSAGLLVNFSQKGLIFKTYEGALNSGSVTTNGGANTNNNTWSFSVKDDKVVEELNQIMRSNNKNVSLHYEEKRGNFFWQGETSRFVDEVEVVK